RAASDVRQLRDAISRCAAVIVTCISFSASANVAGVTSGPTGGALLSAGGAPGVSGVADFAVAPPVDACSSPRHAAIVTARPTGALRRNWRRVFMGRGSEGDACRNSSPPAVARRWAGARRNIRATREVSGNRRAVWRVAPRAVVFSLIASPTGARHGPLRATRLHHRRHLRPHRHAAAVLPRGQDRARHPLADDTPGVLRC